MTNGHSNFADKASGVAFGFGHSVGNVREAALGKRHVVDSFAAPIEIYGKANALTTIFTGDPVSAPAPIPGDPIGWYADYVEGSIYWSAKSGAHFLSGAIRDKWWALGGSTGFLGMPIQDQKLMFPGEFAEFQGGSIYWSTDTGAQEVHGDIRGTWLTLGGQSGVLGYPISDETTTPDERGRYNHFQNGSIYYTSEHGACAIYGPIRDMWAMLGWERSYLRFPVNDVTTTDTGQVVIFERGRIDWIAASQQTIVTPDKILWRTGPVEASFVHGEAAVAMLSNGAWAFRGHVEEHGIFSHNWRFRIAGAFQDSDGVRFFTSESGAVHGSLNFGAASQDWEIGGEDIYIVENWDGLRTSSYVYELHVSTEVLGAVTGVIGGLVIAGLSYLFLKDPDTKVDPGIWPDDQGGAAVGIQIHKEYQ